MSTPANTRRTDRRRDRRRAQGMAPHSSPEHRAKVSAAKRGQVTSAMYGRARRVSEIDVSRVLRVVADRIKAKRIELDVPADEIQAASGVHPATLSHIAKGRKKTTLRTLVRIALALGISLEELIS
jgi:regulator of extracellular matrix RemA (YlzA/DUF370 family)